MRNKPPEGATPAQPGQDLTADVLVTGRMGEVILKADTRWKFPLDGLEGGSIPPDVCIYLQARLTDLLAKPLGHTTFLVEIFPTGQVILRHEAGWPVRPKELHDTLRTMLSELVPDIDASLPEFQEFVSPGKSVVGVVQSGMVYLLRAACDAVIQTEFNFVAERAEVARNEPGKKIHEEEQVHRLLRAANRFMPAIVDAAKMQGPAYFRRNEVLDQEMEREVSLRSMKIKPRANGVSDWFYVRIPAVIGKREYIVEVLHDNQEYTVTFEDAANNHRDVYFFKSEKKHLSVVTVFDGVTIDFNADAKSVLISIADGTIFTTSRNKLNTDYLEFDERDDRHAEEITRTQETGVRAPKSDRMRDMGQT